MKILVAGGTGRVGSQVVDILRRQGHEAVPASLSTGVDLISGKGLAEAMVGMEVVVDAANSPSFEDEAAMRFFETSTRNLAEMEAAAGIRHHVALSIVGAERLQANGYFRAKLAQEQIVKAASVPYTILRATQFFEFLGAIVEASAEDQVVRLAPARVQFIAAQDVAAAVADLAVRPPINGTIEVAGPDPYRLDLMVADYLAAAHDPRRVLADPEAPYFGSTLSDETLIAGEMPRFGHTEFQTWLRRSGPSPAEPSDIVPPPSEGPSS